MATTNNKPSNLSSGIYFFEQDNTVVSQGVGTFSGGAIGLTEKGPAFEIMPSSSFSERQRRLGGLSAELKLDGVTPKYPCSHYAKAFLNQASNYKEVRILGLEGYNEKTSNSISVEETAGLNLNGTDKSFAIVYDMGSPAPRDQGVTPLEATQQSVAAILKPRRRAATGYTDNVDYVEVIASGTDEEFTLDIYFENNVSPLFSVKCSLRPDSKNYLPFVFGTSPLDLTKINGQLSPLWVDFIYPSEKIRLSSAPYLDGSDLSWVPTSTVNPDYELGYRYPGTSTVLSTLDILAGDCTIQSSFVYPSFTTTSGGIVKTSVVTVTSTSAIPTGLADGQRVTLSGVTGLTGTDLNGTWVIDNFSETGTGPYTVVFELVLTASQLTALTGTHTGTATVRKFFSSQWETEVMNLGGVDDEVVEFQTPVTPWYVSDADVNGYVKNLFRLWSISDGDAANTEIKIEIANINPAGNLGKGSFDILVRDFNDTEENKSILEGFTNLTMNPKSDNYVSRRIGDGEVNELRSKYILVEINIDDTLPDNALPYGHLGYPNVDSLVLPDVVFTTEYNLNQPTSKQALGLPRNKYNAWFKITGDYLAYKNVPTSDITNTGIGFHLNPNQNANIDTAAFTQCGETIYYTSARSATMLTGLDKARRSRFVSNFYGGFDGFNVYLERSWGDPNSKDYEALQRALDIFSDKESLDADLSVLVTPDLNFEEHSTATAEILRAMEAREDVLYLADFRYSEESDPQIAALTLSDSDMKSSYCAVYFPHQQIRDEVNKTALWLPPSLIALATIASTATNEAVWQPPAGSLRTITQDLIRPRRRMKINDREILKRENINPITVFPGSGFEITESRTTQEVFSALSFIHNRMLIGYAKKALNQSLRPVLQQLKNQSLIDSFKGIVKPIFQRIKQANGLESFEVYVKNVDDDRTTLYGEVVIVPLYPVERISFTFTLENGTIQYE